jgi:hypothetical protein
MAPCSENKKVAVKSHLYKVSVASHSFLQQGIFPELQQVCFSFIAIVKYSRNRESDLKRVPII